MEKKLTPKQRRFIEEYAVDLNATQAAMRAGYSQKTAREIGAENLSKPIIRREIDRVLQERSERTAITADRVLEGIAAIAFGDIRKLFDEDGNLIRPDQLPEEAAQLLAGVDVVTVNKGEGEVEYVAKIKTNDRLRAFELLGRHLKMFTDRVEHTGLEGLAARIQARRKKAAAR